MAAAWCHDAAADDAPAAAKDVVELKNGVVVQGVISQMDPNGEVEIVSAAGVVRRFSMSEVSYAGPIRAPTPPAGTPSAPPAEIRFKAEGEMITLHEEMEGGRTVTKGVDYAAVSESHSYRQLCTAPCTTQLAPGTYTFGLSRGQDDPVSAGRVVVPTGTSTLEGAYRSRAGMRTAGWIVWIAGEAAGVALVVIGMAPKFSETCAPNGRCKSGDVDAPLVVAGLGTFLASTIVGAVLASRKDVAEVRLVPGSGAHSWPPPLDRRDGPTPRATALPDGVSVVGRFF